MGINITEISQKVLDNNTNAANVFRKMYDLHYNPNPTDVPFEYIDENGNKVITDIKNVAGFRKKVWDDVGGALGQFNRTFYVDAENGDDNNDGSSSTPFKTIKKAVNNIPIGGYGEIYLKTPNNIIDSDITLKNKTIIISGIYIDSDSEEPAIKNVCYEDDYGNATYGFVTTNSYLEFSNLTIRTADYVNTDKNESYYAGLIKRKNTESKNKVVINSSSILIGDTDFIRLSDRQDINLQVYYYDSGHSVTDKTIDCVGANNNGYLIKNEAGTLILSASSIALGTKNDGSTDLTWNDLVTGIVKDADSGNPINLLSNINFSD